MSSFDGLRLDVLGVCDGEESSLPLCIFVPAEDDWIFFIDTGRIDEDGRLVDDDVTVVCFCDGLELSNRDMDLGLLVESCLSVASAGGIVFSLRDTFRLRE